MIKAIRRNPVRVLMLVFALLGAVVGANNTWHVIPDSVMKYVGFAALMLSIWLGEWVRDSVTPLVNPRSAWGEPLVPASMKTDPPPAAGGRGRNPDRS